jgi:phospholipid/cholesterol/gamma-HCH transport system permease protein
MAGHAWALSRAERGEGAAALTLTGQLRFSELTALWSALQAAVVTAGRGQQLDFDMSRVERVDGGSMALLVQLRADLQRRGARSEFLGASEAVQAIIHLYSGDVRVGRLPRLRATGLLEQIGAATSGLLESSKQVFSFFGEAILSAVAVVRRPGSANWGDILPTMERMGADAFPIVMLINFLIGAVMAFQGAVQLKLFGANIYVADLTAISICRELGPLMTAITLCGRSGAAFAAELGSMKVSEEIDALRTLGFGPVRYLVVPRLVALMLVMPLLTVLGDAFGVLGGLVVGVVSLDLTVAGYLIETRKALDLFDIFSGVLKSVVFAVVIVLIACQQGLATTDGALGVGRRTTSSVVSILFALILVDAAFTVAFRALDR